MLSIFNIYTSTRIDALVQTETHTTTKYDTNYIAIVRKEEKR